MKPPKLTTFLMVICCFPFVIETAHADAFAFACQAKSTDNHTITPIQAPHGGACTGFIVTDMDGKEITRVENGYWGSGTLMVSEDGRSVAFVQSSPYATVVGKKIRVHGRGVILTDPLEGLVIFYDGARVGAYSLEELIQRVWLVRLSASHIHWLDDTSILSGALPSELNLTTTSFRRYRFDTTSGELLTAEDTETWKQCDAIAYGDIKKDDDGYRMDPAYSAKGDVPSAISFTSERPWTSIPLKLLKQF